MENYIEQSVSGKMSSKNRLLYVLCWCATFLFVIPAMFFGTGVFGESSAPLQINWLNVLFMVCCLLAAFACFRGKDHFRIEYDYILRESVLEICGILNARRRRRLAELPLECIRQIGPAAGAEYQNLLHDSRLKKHNWFADTDTPKHYIIYIKEKTRQMAVLELNENMLAAMRKSGKLARDAWRNEEGKTSNYASLS